jgi:hypothetical protein
MITKLVLVVDIAFSRYRLASLEVCLLSAIIVLVGQEREIRINPYEFGA